MSNHNSICVLCKGVITPLEFDSFDGYNAINPETNRNANMHRLCHEDAMSHAMHEPSNKPNFETVFDEIINK